MLGLPPETPTFHLIGAGCAGAIPALDFATAYWRRDPSKQVLVVALDAGSMFLGEPQGEDDRLAILNAALFGDGCAALLVGGEASGPQVLDTQVHQVPDTLHGAAFDSSQKPCRMQIARELPDLIKELMPGLVDDFLARHGLTREDVDHWVLHPGGRAILEAFQAGLGLTDEQTARSFGVLREHGNLGTPTSLFVLERILAEGAPKPGDRALMVTAGPGIKLGLALLAWN